MGARLKRLCPPSRPQLEAQRKEINENMAADGHDTLHGYRTHLKEKLEHSFAGGHEEPRKRFARNGIMREIFEPQRLVHLLRLLLYQNTGGIDPSGEDRLNRIAERIRGTGDGLVFCNILAGLLYARCESETLKNWAESLLHDKLRGLFSDSDLPLTESEAEKAFGSEDGLSFWEHQFLFCPVILEEGDESIYVDHRHSCPLPFLDKPKYLGKGAYATVYKVKIERGHLINRTENSALASVSQPPSSSPRTILSYISPKSMRRKYILTSMHQLRNPSKRKEPLSRNSFNPSKVMRTSLLRKQVSSMAQHIASSSILQDTAWTNISWIVK